MTYWEQMHHEISKIDTIRRVLATLGCAGSKGRQEADVLRNHSCKEYVTRLDAVKDILESIYLHDLHFRQDRLSMRTLKLPSPSDILQFQD